MDIKHYSRIFLIFVQLRLFQGSTYQMFFGNASDQTNELISRDIYFSTPVVTNKFKLIVGKAPDSIVFQLDVIGMPPDKKYEADPVLTPQAYEEGIITILYISLLRKFK